MSLKAIHDNKSFYIYIYASFGRKSKMLSMLQKDFFDYFSLLLASKTNTAETSILPCKLFAKYFKSSRTKKTHFFRIKI